MYIVFLFTYKRWRIISNVMATLDKWIKKGISLFFIFFFGILFTYGLQARDNNSITVLRGSGSARQSGVFLLTREQLKKNSVKRLLSDPCFPDLGEQEYRGITVERLLKLSGARAGQALTFIAANQYIAFYSPQSVVRDPILLAFEADGKQIKKNRGGPVKTMPAGIHGFPCDAYCWYIRSVIVGELKRQPLLIEGRKRSYEFSWKQLKSMGNKSFIRSFPIPRGFRDNVKALPRRVSVSTILLSDLLKKDGPGARRIVLHSLEGNKWTLDAKDARLPVKIALKINGSAIRSVYGGPYSVIFPVMEHPELTDRFPKTGAFFFLKKIQVK